MAARVLKTSACLKHFDSYSVETNRMEFGPVVTAQDMADTFLPAFQQGVQQGHVSGVMW